MGELIAVASGKGGTGKTSVCAGVAIVLAQSGRRVLCIDCDVGLRNLDISLGLSDCCPLSFTDVMHGGYSLSQATIHPFFPNLHFLTAPMNCQPENISLADFGTFVRTARDIYDYVFLDAPAGMEAGFRLAVTYADRCILVTGPGPAAIRDASRTAQVLELMGKENIRLVVNRLSRSMVRALNITVDDLMDTAGLPLLGIVPEDSYVTLAAAANQSLLRHRPRSAAAKAYGRIAKRIQGLPEPIRIR